MAKTRHYPTGCTSAFCGRTECAGCPDKPILDEFKAWVHDHKAEPKDRIYSPTLYVAREKAS